jgi:hypothetical protein
MPYPVQKGLDEQFFSIPPWTKSKEAHDMLASHLRASSAYVIETT